MKLAMLTGKGIMISYSVAFIVTFIFILSCSRPGPRLQSVATEEGIEITEGDAKVLFYQVKPKSLNGRFERANYIHPLYSLDGTVITEDFPDDHLHQHGIYSAWHQIIVNDKPVADGWTSENISWDVVDTKVTKENNTIVIASEALWKSLLDGQQPEPIVKENLKIIVQASNDQFRIIDYDVSLFPLKDSLEIGGSEDEKGYGGFSLRLKIPDDIRFIARDKEVEAEILSVNAGPWMDFVGSFDGKHLPAGGVAVFCHPSNPGSPQPWVLRKEKSMQNPAYPGRVPVGLKKEGLNLRYRMVIHKAGLEEKAIEELYQSYAEN